MTKSAEPSATGPMIRSMSAGTSLPSPIEEEEDAAGRVRRGDACRARPAVAAHGLEDDTRPGGGGARSAVASVLPLSTTRISRGMPVARHSRTTSAMGSSSLRQGMMTETEGMEN